MQGPLTERQLVVAAVRRERDAGPDPDDPDGELAYGFVERAVK
jgi:hypothetical protein